MPENTSPRSTGPQSTGPQTTNPQSASPESASSPSRQGAVEIRRIREPEAAAVVGLWDRMCREAPDGGPLTERGRRNLQRMLEMAAWHRETFCLVAVRDTGRDPDVLGFALGYVDSGDGLLPGALGQVHETYVRADAPGGPELRERLAAAVLAGLRERGAGTHPQAGGRGRPGGAAVLARPRVRGRHGGAVALRAAGMR